MVWKMWRRGGQLTDFKPKYIGKREAVGGGGNGLNHTNSNEIGGEGSRNFSGYQPVGRGRGRNRGGKKADRKILKTMNINARSQK